MDAFLIIRYRTDVRYHEMKGDKKMDELERRLIERIRESDEAKRIAEVFIFGGQRSPADQQEPSDAREPSP